MLDIGTAKFDRCVIRTRAIEIVNVFEMEFPIDVMVKNNL